MNKLIYGSSEDALELILSGANCCVTGPGGTGKSHLINTVKTFFEADSIFVSPTGGGALNIGGSTCHRTFGLDFGIYTEGSPLRINKQKRALLSSKSLSRIVIDEAFMLRQDKFIEIIHKLKMVRKIKRDEQLDIQIVLLGDPCQLPPILNNKEQKEYYDNYDSPFVFDSPEFEELYFQRIELTKIYRQADQEFKTVLNDIRFARNLKECCNFINQRVLQNTYNKNVVVLATTNKIVDSINKQRLNELETESKTFIGKVTGDFKEQPSPLNLVLKVGALVTITANSSLDAKVIYTNGNTGVVEKISNHYVQVRIKDQSELNGKLLTLTKHSWYNYESKVGYRNGKEVIEDAVIGSYDQIPLKLCYASSIHKMQGKTLDKAHIDFGWKCFAPSQAYVGLSRLKDLSGMTMARPIKPEDIFVDKRALRYYS